MIFNSHANKTHFHKKGCALGLILKVRLFGTQKWPIQLFCFGIAVKAIFFFSSLSNKQLGCSPGIEIDLWYITIYTFKMIMVYAILLASSKITDGKCQLVMVK